jgi:hypothetical protein
MGHTKKYFNMNRKIEREKDRKTEEINKQYKTLWIFQSLPSIAMLYSNISQNSGN